MAMIQTGRSFANATMLSGRMRRRFTTVPLASGAAKLLLFLSRSIPMTAILAGCNLVPPFSGCPVDLLSPGGGRAIP